MAGGDKLDYPGATSTDTTSLATTKVHLNSVISTPTARYITADIKDFYYGTPLDRFEYLRVRLSLIPPEVVEQYNLRRIAHDGWIYIEVQKGMPGLKQAGKVANDRLAAYLKSMDMHQSREHRHYGVIQQDPRRSLCVSMTSV